MKIQSAAVMLLILIQGMAGCGGSAPAPTPSQPPPTTTTTPPPSGPVQLAVFSDPATGFMTSDVRDVQDQIVRFDTASNSLIWAADGRSFPGYPVSGLFIRGDRFFQVRFTKDGQPRAYFTETVATTICDIEIIGGQLSITATNVHVPGS